MSGSLPQHFNVRLCGPVEHRRKPTIGNRERLGQQEGDLATSPSELRTERVDVLAQDLLSEDGDDRATNGALG